MESRTFEAILDSVGRCYFKTRWGRRKETKMEGRKEEEGEREGSGRRPCSFKNRDKLGMVAHTCNPSALEVEAGGSQI